MSTATLAKNMMVSVIRVGDLVPSPWKNGAGTTTEVASHPQGAGLESFTWRISIADVATSGPFSQFDGVDRTLVLLAGYGMRLTESSGPTHVLGKMLDVARFPGESKVASELIDGPTRNFNLMVSRKSARADLIAWRGGPFETKDADTLLFFCARGHTQVVMNTGTYMLEAHDTLRVDNPDADNFTIRNYPGSVLAIRLFYASAI